MQINLMQRLTRRLRSPALIVAEIAVIALAGVAGVVFPLARVFRSAWFLGVVALTFASLLVVVAGQVRRLVRARRFPRLALLGGPSIHAGLLLVILAAALKALFGADAVVDLLEGEALPPDPVAWTVQQPGMLAAPIRISHPVTLEAVNARRYAAGDLQSLAVRLRLSPEAQGAARLADVPVNKSIEASGVRLFVGSDYGPAALVEWRGADGGLARTAALLQHERGLRFAGELAGPDGARAYLRTRVAPSGSRPVTVDVRVMKGPALQYVGVVRINETITLPSGGSLALRGAPFWARLHASRDPALGLFYLGFALVTLGITLRFARLPPPLPTLPTLLPLPALLLLLACAVGLTGCNEASLAKARKLVERYNTAVSEAYRRGDVKLVDPVVGQKEGKKLTGLIGVRLDLGLTLDAHLLSLEVLEARHVQGELRVRTRERWTYCDRRIGTGEQAGEKAEDSYEMLYFFTRAGRDWLVDRIEFAVPPKLAKPPATWAIAHGRLPGQDTTRPAEGKEGVAP